MPGKIIAAIFIGLLSTIGSTSHAQVAAVKLNVRVPASSDSGNVYVAGSFNYWHAGDSLYKLTKMGEGLYSIILPLFEGRAYEYKYMAGNWERVEMAANASDVANRKLTAMNGKEITDTVALFRTNGNAGAKLVSAQRQKLNAMKDSTIARLQPELANIQEVLKKSIMNLVQDQPSKKAFRKGNKEAMEHVGKLYKGIADLLWDVFASLTPEQKKVIREAMSKPGDKDVMNNISKALDKAVDGTNPSQ
jgi:hypothetical protein